MKPFHLTFRMGMLLITGILITVAGILFRQPWYYILPLYISLFVMLLQARANRYAFLLGGLNCILYTVVYVFLQLYATALSTLLISCTLQILTFFRWKRNAYGNSTVLRCLSNKQRWLCAVACVVAWMGMNLLFSGTDASLLKRLLDNASFVVGLVATLASLFSLVEYPVLQLMGNLLSFPLYILLMTEDLGQTTYLIFNIYSVVCVCMSWRTVRALYYHQQEERNLID